MNKDGLDFVTPVLDIDYIDYTVNTTLADDDKNIGDHDGCGDNKDEFENHFLVTDGRSSSSYSTLDLLFLVWVSFDGACTLAPIRSVSRSGGVVAAPCLEYLINADHGRREREDEYYFDDIIITYARASRTQREPANAGLSKDDRFGHCYNLGLRCRSHFRAVHVQSPRTFASTTYDGTHDGTITSCSHRYHQRYRLEDQHHESEVGWTSSALSSAARLRPQPAWAQTPRHHQVRVRPQAREVNYTLCIPPCMRMRLTMAPIILTDLLMRCVVTIGLRLNNIMPIIPIATKHEDRNRELAGRLHCCSADYFPVSYLFGMLLTDAIQHRRYALLRLLRQAIPPSALDNKSHVMEILCGNLLCDVDGIDGGISMHDEDYILNVLALDAVDVIPDISACKYAYAQSSTSSSATPPSSHYLMPDIFVSNSCIAGRDGEYFVLDKVEVDLCGFAALSPALSCPVACWRTPLRGHCHDARGRMDIELIVMMVTLLKRPSPGAYPSQDGQPFGVAVTALRLAHELAVDGNMFMPPRPFSIMMYIPLHVYFAKPIAIDYLRLEVINVDAVVSYWRILGCMRWDTRLVKHMVKHIVNTTGYECNGNNDVLHHLINERAYEHHLIPTTSTTDVYPHTSPPYTIRTYGYKHPLVANATSNVTDKPQPTWFITLDKPAYAVLLKSLRLLCCSGRRPDESHDKHTYAYPTHIRDATVGPREAAPGLQQQDGGVAGGCGIAGEITPRLADYAITPITRTTRVMTEALAIHGLIVLIFRVYGDGGIAELSKNLVIAVVFYIETNIPSRTLCRSSRLLAALPVLGLPRLFVDDLNMRILKLIPTERPSQRPHLIPKNIYCLGAHRNALVVIPVRGRSADCAWFDPWSARAPSLPTDVGLCTRRGGLPSGAYGQDLLLVTAGAPMVGAGMRNVFINMFNDERMNPDIDPCGSHEGCRVELWAPYAGSSCRDAMVVSAIGWRLPATSGGTSSSSSHALLRLPLSCSAIRMTVFYIMVDTHIATTMPTREFMPMHAELFMTIGIQSHIFGGLGLDHELHQGDGLKALLGLVLARLAHLPYAIHRDFTIEFAIRSASRSSHVYSAGLPRGPFLPSLSPRRAQARLSSTADIDEFAVILTLYLFRYMGDYLADDHCIVSGDCMMYCRFVVICLPTVRAPLPGGHTTPAKTEHHGGHFGEHMRALRCPTVGRSTHRGRAHRTTYLDARRCYDYQVDIDARRCYDYHVDMDARRCYDYHVDILHTPHYLTSPSVYPSRYASIVGAYALDHSRRRHHLNAPLQDSYLMECLDFGIVAISDGGFIHDDVTIHDDHYSEEEHNYGRLYTLRSLPPLYSRLIIWRVGCLTWQLKCPLAVHQHGRLLHPPVVQFPRGAFWRGRYHRDCMHSTCLIVWQVAGMTRQRHFIEALAHLNLVLCSRVHVLFGLASSALRGLFTRSVSRSRVEKAFAYAARVTRAFPFPAGRATISASSSAGSSRPLDILMAVTLPIKFVMMPWPIVCRRLRHDYEQDLVSSKRIVAMLRACGPNRQERSRWCDVCLTHRMKDHFATYFGFSSSRPPTGVGHEIFEHLVTWWLVCRLFTCMCDAYLKSCGMLTAFGGNLDMSAVVNMIPVLYVDVDRYAVELSRERHADHALNPLITDGSCAVDGIDFGIGLRILLVLLFRPRQLRRGSGCRITSPTSSPLRRDEQFSEYLMRMAVKNNIKKDLNPIVGTSTHLQHEPIIKLPFTLLNEHSMALRASAFTPRSVSRSRVLCRAHAGSCGSLVEPYGSTKGCPPGGVDRLPLDGSDFPCPSPMTAARSVVPLTFWSRPWDPAGRPDYLALIVTDVWFVTYHCIYLPACICRDPINTYTTKFAMMLMISSAAFLRALVASMSCRRTSWRALTSGILHNGLYKVVNISLNLTTAVITLDLSLVLPILPVACCAGELYSVVGPGGAEPYILHVDPIVIYIAIICISMDACSHSTTSYSLTRPAYFTWSIDDCSVYSAFHCGPHDELNAEPFDLLKVISLNLFHGIFGFMHYSVVMPFAIDTILIYYGFVGIAGNHVAKMIILYAELFMNSFLIDLTVWVEPCTYYGLQLVREWIQHGPSLWPDPMLHHSVMFWSLADGFIILPSLESFVNPIRLRLLIDFGASLMRLSPTTPLPICKGTRAHIRFDNVIACARRYHCNSLLKASPRSVSRSGDGPKALMRGWTIRSVPNALLVVKIILLLLPVLFGYASPLCYHPGEAHDAGSKISLSQLGVCGHDRCAYQCGLGDHSLLLPHRCLCLPVDWRRGHKGQHARFTLERFRADAVEVTIGAAEGIAMEDGTALINMSYLIASICRLVDAAGSRDGLLGTRCPIRFVGDQDQHRVPGGVHGDVLHYTVITNTRGTHQQRGWVVERRHRPIRAGIRHKERHSSEQQVPRPRTVSRPGLRECRWLSGVLQPIMATASTTTSRTTWASRWGRRLGYIGSNHDDIHDFYLYRVYSKIETISCRAVGCRTRVHDSRLVWEVATCPGPKSVQRYVGCRSALILYAIARMLPRGVALFAARVSSSGHCEETLMVSFRPSRLGADAPGRGGCHRFTLSSPASVKLCVSVLDLGLEPGIPVRGFPGIGALRRLIIIP